MLLRKVYLTGSIKVLMDSFADEFMKEPDEFILKHIPNIKNTINDKSDPNFPGISDSFILNHDLTSIDWGENLTLRTSKFSDMYKIAYPPAEISIKLIEYLEEVTGKHFVSHRGNFLYLPNGYMGWHTNSDVPGTRAYVTYANKEKESYFKYVERNGLESKIITDWDDIGWSIRIFEPSNRPENYFWHCVNSENAMRISYGFMLK